MGIVFVQTADPIRYRIFLEITSQTVREYCARHGFGYESFLGIARGYHPWQATYNRIPILRRWADSGFSGWICYLDADAYIADLAFDLRAYLRQNKFFSDSYALWDPAPSLVGCQRRSLAHQLGPSDWACDNL